MEPALPSHFQIPSDIQIRKIGVVLAGLAVAIYFGTQVGESDLKFVIGVIFMLAMFALVLALGSRAWLLMPIGMTLSVNVPVTFGRDFSLAEMTSMLLLGHTVFQVALRRQKLVVFRKEHLWPLLYIGWAFMVFVLNPTGLLSFGSEVVGARFYFQLFLAVSNFLIIANLVFQERDGRWFFIGLISAQAINIFYNIYQYRMGSASSIAEGWMNPGFGEGDYYTWHQVLSIPAGMCLMFLLAYYPPQKFFKLESFGWWILILLCISLVFLSGKRQMVGILLALPVLAAVARKRYGYAGAMVLGLLLFVGALTIGQGRFFELPLVAQRALSIFPGQWNPAADLGWQDDFRKILREDALRQIHAHPLIGKGFAFDENTYWVNLQETRGKIISGVRAMGSWHNTWLGIAADFGIPAAVIWGLLVFSFILLSLRLARSFPEGSMFKTMAVFIFFMLCQHLLTSWTGGHSASLPFNSWWIWALVLPLKQVAEGDKKLRIEKGELRNLEN